MSKRFYLPNVWIRKKNEKLKQSPSKANYIRHEHFWKMGFLKSSDHAGGRVSGNTDLHEATSMNSRI